MPSTKSSMQKNNSKSKNWKKKKQALKRNKKESKASAVQSFRVYVSGLPGDTTKKELERFLRQFGEFSHLKLPMRKTNGAKECKGHAKIMLKDEEAKIRIFQEGHLKKFKGEHVLKFESYLEGQSLVHKMASIEEKKVSIYGEYDVEHGKLVSAFRQFGVVQKLTWKVKEDKVPAGPVEESLGGLEEGRAELARPSDEDDATKKEFYGNITFSEKDSAVTCLKTGRVRITSDIVVRVRPYLAQFLAKKNSLNSKGQSRKNSESTQGEANEQKTVEIPLSQLSLTSPTQKLQEERQHCYRNLRFNSANLEADLTPTSPQATLSFPSIEDLSLFPSPGNRPQEIGKPSRLETPTPLICPDNAGDSGYFSISSFYRRTNSFNWLNESHRKTSISPASIFNYKTQGLNHLKNF